MSFYVDGEIKNSMQYGELNGLHASELKYVYYKSVVEMQELLNGFISSHHLPRRVVADAVELLHLLNDYRTGARKA